MNKVAQRLLIFFIGIPVIIGIILLSFYNHLLLNIAIVTASAIAAFEFYNMASKKFTLFPRVCLIVLTVILPISAYLCNLFNIDYAVLTWILVFELFIIIGIESIKQKTFEKSLEKISVSTFLIFYCGLMPTFISRITFIPEYSTVFLILYFILVFMCDSGAWFFGVLFGKSTRGHFAASPNKSIVGFIGGLITSAVFGLIIYFIFPETFPGSIWKIELVSLLTALASIIGDLIESVFKRSCEVKDSGNLIPGRGGILDCIDSLLLAAPIFYTLVHFLYLV